MTSIERANLLTLDGRFERKRITRPLLKSDFPSTRFRYWLFRNRFWKDRIPMEAYNLWRGLYDQ